MPEYRKNTAMAATRNTGQNARVIQNSMQIVRRLSQPRVASAHLRTLWNGWPTSRRMRFLKEVLPTQTCVLGCDRANDCIEHYAVCPVLWKFFTTPMPRGLGILPERRRLECFLLADENLSTVERVALARANYVAIRSVHSSRLSGTPATITTMKLFANAAQNCRG